MQSTKSMKVLKKEPGKAPVVVTIDGSLSSMQDLVGGSIELMLVPRCKAIMGCNEDARSLGLPYNFTLLGQRIVGTVFFCCRSNQADMVRITPSVEKQIRQLLMLL